MNVFFLLCICKLVYEQINDIIEVLLCKRQFKGECQDLLGDVFLLVFLDIVRLGSPVGGVRRVHTSRQ